MKKVLSKDDISYLNISGIDIDVLDLDEIIDKLEDEIQFIDSDNENLNKVGIRCEEILNKIRNLDSSNEKIYTYVSVAYNDDIVATTIKEPFFYYKTDLKDIAIGNKVLVDRAGKKIDGEVVDIEYFNEDDVPFPVEKTKDIIKILEYGMIDVYQYESNKYVPMEVIGKYKYINLPVCSDSEIESSGQINEEQLKPFNAPLKISDMNVTSFFMEERIVYGNADVHKAWDFSASNNTPVYATCEGVVTQVSFKYSTNTIDKNGGGGNQIKIKCENDEETTYEVWYAHLYPNSAKVKVGDKVKGWQQIAEVGTTGYSTGPHLHYQVSLNGSYIDGMSLIDFTSEDSSSYKPPLEKPSFGNNNGLDNFLDR